MRKKNHNFSDFLVISTYRVLESIFPLYMVLDETHDPLTCHQWAIGNGKQGRSYFHYQVVKNFFIGIAFCPLPPASCPGERNFGWDFLSFVSKNYQFSLLPSPFSLLPSSSAPLLLCSPPFFSLTPSQVSFLLGARSQHNLDVNSGTIAEQISSPAMAKMSTLYETMIIILSSLHYVITLYCPDFS